MDKAKNDRKGYFLPYILVSFSIIFTGMSYSFQFTSFLYPKEISLALFILFLIPFITKEDSVELDIRILLVFSLVVSACLLSIFWARVPEITLIKVGEMSLIFLACVGVSIFYKDVIIERFMFWSVWISGVAVAIFTILQTFGLVPVLFPTFSHYTQVYSVMGNQILVGGYLAMCTLWILERYKKLNVDYPWVGIFLLISIAGLLLTHSRSAWLAFVIPFSIFSVMGVTRKTLRKEIYYSLFLVGLTVLVVLSKISLRVLTSFSTQDIGFWVRLWIYAGTFRMITRHLPLGVGFGNFYYWLPVYLGESANSNEKFLRYCNEILTFHAHCDYLEWIAELGFLGFITAIVLYLSWFIKRKVSMVWMCWLILSMFNFTLIVAPISYLAFLSVLERKCCEFISLSGDKWKWFTKFYGTISICLICFLAIALWIPDYKLRQTEKKFLLGMDCVEDYEKLVSGYFTPVPAYEGLANAYIKKGDYEKAYKVLLNSLKVTDSGSVYILLGRCAHILGRESEAVKWYKEALLRFPKNEEAINFCKKVGK